MVSQNSAGRLPEVGTIKRTIRNVRKAHDAAPAIPQSRQDLTIPDGYRTTDRGEKFLQFDSGAISARMLIFGTERSIKLLERSDNWYMDGTFKTVPLLFGQLYTVHGLKENAAIPLLYVLLPDKTQISYSTMLTEIKQLCPAANPVSVMMDFEKAAINAVSQSFHEVAIKGCFFHFTQCIYRKIQAHGLKQKYDTDAEFSLTMRMLSALAFVPVPHVVEAFEQLCDNNIFPEDAQEIVDYFEDTWIGRPNRRNLRRPPLFAIEMWNCFEAAQSGLPKTNNAVEGWHRSFENQISAAHPSIWRFIEGIKREHALNELKIEQYTAGAPSSAPRKKYKDVAERIQRLVNNFNPLNILDFLRGVAQNIGY